MRQRVAIIVLALLPLLSLALAGCTSDVLVGERAPDADTDACAFDADADAPDACAFDADADAPDADAADAADSDGLDADARADR